MNPPHLDQELAHRYAAGLLSADETREIKAHLATCARCRLLVKEERTWSGVFQVLTTPDEAAAQRRELLAAPAYVQTPRGMMLGWRNVIVVGLLAGALGGGAGVLFRVSSDRARRAAIESAPGAAQLRELVAQLSALETLERDRWRPGELEMLSAFAEQLALPRDGG